MIWTPSKHYHPWPYTLESELEAAITEVKADLFGSSRIYLDVKKLIGAKGKTKNIPDGYLIDLASKKEPRLFVVENELSRHESLDHIAKQILQFSLSFESSPLKVKEILKSALKLAPPALQTCEEYALANRFENVDYLLECIVQKNDNAFNALVIIDKLDDELETLLFRRFRFPVEVLTLRRFKALDGQKAYEFEPFLAGVAGEAEDQMQPTTADGDHLDLAELDTIIVPAKQDGFEKVFVGEDRWYKVRIHSSMIPRIRYIGVYQVAPVSAITRIARVKNIEPWPNSSKYVLNFVEPAKAIGPIKLVPKPRGTAKAPQAPRYTNYERLMKAKNLDSVF